MGTSNCLGETIGAHSALHPHAGAYQARQHFVAEIRHLGEIIDERQADAAHAGLADDGKLLGDAVGRADERIAADGLAAK